MSKKKKPPVWVNDCIRVRVLEDGAYHVDFNKGAPPFLAGQGAGGDKPRLPKGLVAAVLSGVAAIVIGVGFFVYHQTQDTGHNLFEMTPEERKALLNEMGPEIQEQIKKEALEAATDGVIGQAPEPEAPEPAESDPESQAEIESAAVSITVAAAEGSAQAIEAQETTEPEPEASDPVEDTESPKELASYKGGELIEQPTEPINYNSEPIGTAGAVGQNNGARNYNPNQAGEEWATAFEQSQSFKRLIGDVFDPEPVSPIGN